MKYYLLFICFISIYTLSAQTRIKFNYDNEGNQTERIICSICNAKTVIDSLVIAQTITNDEMLLESTSQISFYPNPVKEELYLKWEYDSKNPILNIDVYSQTGQSIQKITVMKGNDTSTILFVNYPSGFYNVLVTYKNGQRETLKIVKK